MVRRHAPRAAATGQLGWPTHSRVERGAINISIEGAEVLAKAVGVPLGDLVDPNKSPDIDDA